MAIILNIDTSIDTASVCLAKDGLSIGQAVNERQKDHASWLHETIRGMLNNAGINMTELNAVAVSIGPGSYTGLRIGLSAAKGLCYALNIPLITVGTLELMAFAVRQEITDLVCPMIDARRSEVFTAVYDQSFKLLLEPVSMILDAMSFRELLDGHNILFAGNGAPKLQALINHPRAHFSQTSASAADLAVLAYRNFTEKRFTELAYSEPFYIKEFYTAPR